jgi:hypothetical protein
MARKIRVERKGERSKSHLLWMKREAEDRVSGGSPPSVGSTTERAASMPAAVLLLTIPTGNGDEAVEEDEGERGRSVVKVKETDRRGYLCAPGRSCVVGLLWPRER